MTNRRSYGWTSVTESDIHVTLRPKEGLRAVVHAIVAYDKPYSKGKGDVERQGAYCAMINQRRVDERWKSSGVVEFFTKDEKEFKLMLWGPPTKFVGDPKDGQEEECDYDDLEAFLGYW